jgi:hypothetical protein
MEHKTTNSTLIIDSNQVWLQYNSQMELKIGDKVKIVGGTYRGDSGYIVKFLEVRVSVRLVLASKTVNLNKESLSRYKITSVRRSGTTSVTTNTTAGRPYQSGEDDVLNQTDLVVDGDSDSVTYLIQTMKRMRLSTPEKMTLMYVLKKEIREELDSE